MSFGREHDLHKRRKGRNLGLGLVLIGFVAVMFGLTVVKVTEGQFAEALAGVSRSEYAKIWFRVDLLPFVTVNIGTLAES